MKRLQLYQCGETGTVVLQVGCVGERDSILMFSLSQSAQATVGPGEEASHKELSLSQKMPPQGRLASLTPRDRVQ